MHDVSGRLSCVPSLVKDSWVSPRPCSRISTFVGGWEEGAAVVSFQSEGIEMGV